MNHKFILSATFSAVCVAVSMPACAAQFNFSYRFHGEKGLVPLQVFDDGVNTFFQFRNNNRVVPVIVVDVNGQTYVANYSNYGPYVVVPGVASSFRLEYGSLSATVVQEGGRQTIAVPPAANPAAMNPVLARVSTAEFRPAVQRVVGYGPVGPIAGGDEEARQVRSSAGQTPAATPADLAGIMSPESKTLHVPFAMDSAKLTPKAMKVIADALRGPGEIGRVVIVGRDDVNYKDGIAAERAKNMAQALERYGVPAGRISQRVGIPREDEDAKHPSSDIEVTRVVVRSQLAPEQKAAAAAGVDAATEGRVVAAGPTTQPAVLAAISTIREGLMSLVRLGWLSQARSDAAMEVVSHGLAGVPQRNGGPGQGAPGANPGRPMGGGADGAAVLSASATQDTWSMGPADGTALSGLAKWATKAGWEFESRAGVDYPITKPIQVRGDAKTAVDYVISLLKGTKRPLRYHMEGNKMVVEG
jgi:hypothetical protein